MSMTRRICIWTLAIGFSHAVCAPALADELACKPGVEETTFAKATYLMPAKNIHQLRGELEVWATESDMAGGGTGSYDPKTGIHTWTVIMDPKEQGVMLTVHFTTKSDRVDVAVENVCWEKQEDWRPSWQLLNNKLMEWGYRPATDH
jgi:hypothetical protein